MNMSGGMRNHLVSLFRGKSECRPAGKVDRAYVSEFTQFINNFLEKHPEAVEDQLIGRSLLWDRKVDIAETLQAEQDRVPDDNYGFSYAAWLRSKKTGGPPTGNNN